MDKKALARRVMTGAALTAGVIAAGSGIANAAANGPLAEDQTSTGNNGILNGSQIVAPIQVPVNVCGNSIAVLGVSGAGCDGGSSATQGDNYGIGEDDQLSAGNNGVGNGTQVQAPIQVPIDVCGNSVAVAGLSGAGCDGGASADQSNEDALLGDQTSVDNQGVANGTQAQIPVQVPVDACGNSVAALVGFSGAGCDGGATAQSDASTVSPEADGNADLGDKALTGGGLVGQVSGVAGGLLPVG